MACSKGSFKGSLRGQRVRIEAWVVELVNSKLQRLEACFVGVLRISGV